MEINMAEDVSSMIAALEDERYTAMLSGDAGTLDRLLDDRLRHVHSSGHVDNKASWMSNFVRLWQYRSIERQGQDDCPVRRQRFGFQYAPRRCLGRGRPAEGGCTRTDSLEQVRRCLASGRRIFGNLPIAPNGSNSAGFDV
jgi:uncharacterized protein DUF4440